MSEITYPGIEPLLADAKIEGTELRCTFTCPLTGADHVGVGDLKEGRTVEDVSTVERSLVESVKLSLASLLRSALSSQPSAHSEAASKLLERAREGTAYTQEELQAAVVVAFRSVAKRFSWDEKGERWICASAAGELLTPFARQLGVAPVLEQQDKRILSRMLSEIARADGKVTPTEWAFLGTFVPADVRSVDVSMEQPDLTAEELDGASRGAARDTMLMLACGLALTDADFDDDELAQLLAYARGLRVPEPRAKELLHYAQEHLLDDALARAYAKGKVHEKRLREAHALAERVGLSAEETAAAEASFKRRRGID